MTFEEWFEVNGGYDGAFDNTQSAAKAAWEVAFDKGVMWTLRQDANTINKLILALESGE